LSFLDTLCNIQARQYYATSPMWDRIDPLAEKYYGISPYAYCGGDPVNFGDYDGMQPDSLEAAVMCQHLYGDVDKPIGGWIQNSVTTNKSGLKYGVYSRTKEDGTTEYAVVYCGTEGLFDGKGWKANLKQAGNESSAQYDEALQFAKDFERNVQRDYICWPFQRRWTSGISSSIYWK